MAEKVVFDDGILELEINGRGLLRFNASDFNVYQRLLGLIQELPEMEQDYAARLEQIKGPDPETQAEGSEEEAEFTQTAAFMDQIKEVDRKIKARLTTVFGSENDFDQLLGGVNLMAFGRNGERVITNLLDVLLPYFEDGVKQHRKAEADEAVAQAKLNRTQRRALG